MIGTCKTNYSKMSLKLQDLMVVTGGSAGHSTPAKEAERRRGF